MQNDADRAPLSRPLKVEEIEEATTGEIAATADEMAAIARMLDLVALHSLAFNYRLVRAGEDRLHLSGRLNAQVTQTCVVSLDPVVTSLDVPVEADFWPAPLLETLHERNIGEAGNVASFDWPEAITDGKIDLGSLVYETLATALDPYPKREGASFAWPQDPTQTAPTGQTGPFAALATLKRR
jgi:uncharacterized metal-binding protein YceD (DUF177 family)